MKNYIYLIFFIFIITVSCGKKDNPIYKEKKSEMLIIEKITT